MAGDDIGLLWETPTPGKKKHAVRLDGGGGKREPVRRALLPFPETDWAPPDAFPDLAGAKLLSLDTETHDPDLKAKGPGVRRGGRILGVSIATDDGFAGYYPIAHPGGGNFDAGMVFRWLGAQLGRAAQPKVMVNGLYDLDYLAEAGVRVDGPIHDLQVAEPLLDENADSYSLDTLAQQYLGEGKRFGPIESWVRRMYGESADPRAHLWEMPAAMVGPYAEGDVLQPLAIWPKQRERLERDNLLPIFELESRQIPLLLAMRRRGVRVDVDRAEQLKVEFERIFAATLAEIQRLTGYRPDIWAADSVETLLERAGITVPRTPTGKPSIRKEWLAKLDHPIARLLGEARKVDKFRGTFVEGHILGNLVGDRIHGQFHQLRGDENGTVSGRYSSSNPNLQNIPVRDKKYGPMLRSLFIPDDGEVWANRDYSQIEYRLVVHYAALIAAPGVQAALDAYRNDPDTDFHQMVAAMTGLARGDAKNFNFGMVYGQGIKLIAATLGISEAAARKLSKEYHGKAPYIRFLSNLVQEKAAKDGFIYTLLGRRRRYDRWEDINGDLHPRGHIGDPAKGDRRAFVFAALNGLIQGSAADLLKQAMADIWDAGCSHILGPPMLTIHDELNFSFVDDKIGREAIREVTYLMEHAVEAKLPIVASGGEGRNWAEAKAA